VAFLYASGALAALWVFNAIVGASLGRRVGQDNHFLKTQLRMETIYSFARSGLRALR
jgi:hypothetical protein